MDFTTYTVSCEFLCSFPELEDYLEFAYPNLIQARLENRNLQEKHDNPKWYLRASYNLGFTQISVSMPKSKDIQTRNGRGYFVYQIVIQEPTGHSKIREGLLEELELVYGATIKDRVATFWSTLEFSVIKTILRQYLRMLITLMG